MRFWFSVQLFLILGSVGLAAQCEGLQIDAGIAGQAQVICANNSAQLGIATCLPAGYSYYWTSSVSGDPSFNGNQSIYNPIVYPDVTTIYTLTITRNGCIEQFSEDVIVNVIEEFEVSELFYGDEFMENAVIDFFVSTEMEFLPEQNFNWSFEFVFSYEDGTSDLFLVESILGEGMFSHIMEVVPDFDFDHLYLASLNVNLIDESDGSIICSTFEPLNYSVHELWIEKFTDSYYKKPWKIILNDAIEFSALSSESCTAFSWSMEQGGNGEGWSLENNNFQNSFEGDMIIPVSDLVNSNGELRASNSWFGNTFGNVQVECRDPYFNLHSVFLSEQQTELVEVFFHKQSRLDGTVDLYLPGKPLWYIFWQEGEVVEGMERVKLFENTLSAEGQYYAPIDGIILYTLSARDPLHTQKLVTTQNGVPYFLNGTSQHIDRLAETLAHELHHIIYFEAYNQNDPNYMDTDLDQIQNDEEVNPVIRNFFPDSNPNENLTFTQTGICEWPNCSTIGDQEIRCRILEVNEKTIVHYDKDWSVSDYYTQNWNE